jgi:hypothetical protein
MNVRKHVANLAATQQSGPRARIIFAATLWSIFAGFAPACSVSEKLQNLSTRVKPSAPKPSEDRDAGFPFDDVPAPNDAPEDDPPVDDLNNDASNDAPNNDTSDDLSDDSADDGAPSDDAMNDVPSDDVVVDAGPTSDCETNCVDLTTAACRTEAIARGSGIQTEQVQDLDFTLNVEAQILSDRLRVNAGTTEGRGSAFLTEPFAIEPNDNAFVHFTFQISPGDVPGADGVVFVLHNAALGPSAIGGVGGLLGYSGIQPSVALAFDTYQDVGADQVLLLRNGEFTPSAGVDWPGPLDDSVIRHVWLELEAGLAKVFVAEAAQQPSAPLFEPTSIALQTEVGARAFAGFTASTGAQANIHDILGEFWVIVSDLPKCQ